MRVSECCSLFQELRMTISKEASLTMPSNMEISTLTLFGTAYNFYTDRGQARLRLQTIETYYGQKTNMENLGSIVDKRLKECNFKQSYFARRIYISQETEYMALDVIFDDLALHQTLQGSQECFQKYFQQTFKPNSLEISQPSSVGISKSTKMRSKSTKERTL